MYTSLMHPDDVMHRTINLPPEIPETMYGQNPLDTDGEVIPGANEYMSLINIVDIPDYIKWFGLDPVTHVEEKHNYITDISVEGISEDNPLPALVTDRNADMGPKVNWSSVSVTANEFDELLVSSDSWKVTEAGKQFSKERRLKRVDGSVVDNQGEWTLAGLATALLSQLNTWLSTEQRKSIRFGHEIEGDMYPELDSYVVDYNDQYMLPADGAKGVSINGELQPDEHGFALFDYIDDFIGDANAFIANSNMVNKERLQYGNVVAGMNHRLIDGFINAYVCRTLGQGPQVIQNDKDAKMLKSTLLRAGYFQSGVVYSHGVPIIIAPWDHLTQISSGDGYGTFRTFININHVGGEQQVGLQYLNMNEIDTSDIDRISAATKFQSHDNGFFLSTKNSYKRKTEYDMSFEVRSAYTMPQLQMKIEGIREKVIGRRRSYDPTSKDYRFSQRGKRRF